MTRLLRGSMRHRACAAMVGACVLAGCASKVSVPPTSPFYGTSLPPYDAVVRHHLLDPSDEGLRAVRDAAPKDDVIRLLNTGLMLHRLGRYEESNDTLQRAERIATDRYTRSLLQDLATLVVSDNVVDYQASALERSMIHYYGMLNYLALSEPEEALVEARRANALLRRYANDFPERSFVNDASVQYMAGMLQWGEREENDAIVSLRTALAGYDEYDRNYGLRIPEPAAVDVARVASAVGLDAVAEQVVARELPNREAEAREPARGSDFGDVLLVVENGFIAYKRQQKLFVPILKSERDAVLSGGTTAALSASFDIILRTVIVMTQMSREGQDYVQAHEDGVTFVSGALSAVGLELITMAWATYEPGTRRATDIRVSTPDGRSWAPTVMEDLSAIAVRDFEERKTSMLVRMTARTLLKEAGVIQSERAGERAGGVLGGLAARVAARTVANATERADTRSWSGLPAELLLTRLRLPPGRHELVVDYRGITGPARRTVTVDVVAGSVVLATVAVVGRDDWDRDRLRRAESNVKYAVPPRTAPATPPRG